MSKDPPPEALLGNRGWLVQALNPPLPGLTRVNLVDSREFALHWVSTLPLKCLPNLQSSLPVFSSSMPSLTWFLLPPVLIPTHPKSTPKVYSMLFLNCTQGTWSDVHSLWEVLNRPQKPTHLTLPCESVSVNWNSERSMGSSRVATSLVSPFLCGCWLPTAASVESSAYLAGFRANVFTNNCLLLM